MPSNLLIGRKEAEGRERKRASKSGIRLAMREMERSGEGKKEREEK